MTKEKRQEGSAARIRRDVHGRSSAAGTWVLTAAFVMLLLISAGHDVFAGEALPYTQVEPIEKVTGGALIECEDGYLLNINLASAEDLQLLGGIGEVLAGRIVTWREENGLFTSVEQLREVSGIGEAKLGAIRELITVDTD